MCLRNFTSFRFMLAVRLVFSSCAATAPAFAAQDPVIDSRLSCTLPTNCVNSRTSSGLSPLRFNGTAAQGLALLQATLASFPEATVLLKDDRTVEAVFTTPAGFRDNVLFLLDPQQSLIDFKSHSVFGLYDFGKNRSRMEAITARFADAAAKSK